MKQRNNQKSNINLKINLLPKYTIKSIYSKKQMTLFSYSITSYK